MSTEQERYARKLARVKAWIAEHPEHASNLADELGSEPSRVPALRVFQDAWASMLHDACEAADG